MPWDKVCQGVLVGMGDTEKIAWGYLRAFPFLVPKGHWHLLAWDTGGCLPLLLLTLPLVGLYTSWPQGALSLISWVLPSLRRQISCCKSFSIFTIQATVSSSYLAHLCLKTTFCSTKGTSFLYLEATSFSPIGSDATGGTLVPLLFLDLGAILLRRDCFIPPLYLIPSGVAKMCGSFFGQYPGPSRNKNPEPFTCCFKGLGLVYHS